MRKLWPEEFFRETAIDTFSRRQNYTVLLRYLDCIIPNIRNRSQRQDGIGGRINIKSRIKKYAESLLRGIYGYLKGARPPVVISLGFLLVLLVGLVDLVTGYYLAFSIFYLIPIALVTWIVGKRPGIVISLCSAVVWFLADVLSEHAYPHPLIPYWNAALRLGIFLIVSYLLASLRESLEIEKRHAREDHLTRVSNSRAFYEMAGAEIRRLKRRPHPLSLVYIDLDNFKYINDTLGHNTGDKLLAEVGRLIRENLRTIDLVARLGGDEFAVLLIESDETAAAQLTERIRSKLLQAMKQNDWPVTFSIGVATFRSPPISVKEMVKAGDGLMYSVKANGKNQIECRVFV